MKILFLENAPIASKLRVTFNDTSKYDVVDLSNVLSEIPIEKIAKEIHDTHSGTELFIINANVLVSGKCRTDFAGIELLKYIRLYGMNQHVILYSFMSREQIMQQSIRHSIIFSKGLSFYRLPDLIKDIISDKFYKNINKTVIDKAPDDLSDFFKAEYQLPDNRHFVANWWGMLQLLKVQKAIDNIASSSKLADIERLFSASIKEMYSYQGMVAKYLNKQKEQNLKSELSQLVHERNIKFNDIVIGRSKVEEEIEKNSEKLNDNDKELNMLIDLKVEESSFLRRLISKVFPNETVINVEQRIQRLVEDKQSITKDISHLNEYHDILVKIEKEKERIYESNRTTNRQLVTLQQKLEKELCFTSNNFSLKAIRESLQKEQPRIVYVDDCAKEGWSSILQKMIYGTESESFIEIVPDQEDSCETIADVILQKLENARLLILDIRLKNETGQIDPSKLSGIQVLNLLKERFITCPVLIVSASNKIWSLKEAFVNGACAFWTKEGLDNQFDTKGSVENYLRLIDLIYSLTNNSKLFSIIAQINQSIDKIQKATEPFWWEGKFWKDECFDEDTKKTTIISKNIIEKEIIITILSHVVDLIKDMLDNTFLKGEIFVPESFFPVAVGRLSLVLEEIHRINTYGDKKNYDIGLSKKIFTQLGKEVCNYYSELTNIRNRSVHKYTCLSVKTFEKYTNLLISYLFENFESIEVIKDDDVNNDTPLQQIRKRLGNGELVEVTVVSHIGNYVNFYIDENESVSLFSRKMDGTEIIPNADDIKQGSVLLIQAIRKEKLALNEQLERGIIYRIINDKKFPLLQAVTGDN